MNASSDQVMCLNLKTLQLISEPTDPAHCWLISHSDTLPEGLDPSAFFLFSAPADSDWVACGQASPLSEAQRFITDLAAGGISATVPLQVCDHLKDLEQSDNPFGVEREAFAAQFARKEPALGLNGFLNKNRSPFTCPAHLKPTLKTLSTWLDS